jgi:hypothetical protein
MVPIALTLAMIVMGSIMLIKIIQEIEVDPWGYYPRLSYLRFGNCDNISGCANV